MNKYKQISVAVVVGLVVVGLVVAGAAMIKDKMTNAEWVVSPEQVAQAKAEGKPGYESSPGTVTVLPIRSEKADILPFTWVFFGLAAGGAAFVVARRKSA